MKIEKFVNFQKLTEKQLSHSFFPHEVTSQKFSLDLRMLVYFWTDGGCGQTVVSISWLEIFDQTQRDVFREYRGSRGHFLSSLRK